MHWLKQSTSITAKIGPFVDEDDGKTAETGLTISQADIRLSKNGGNYAQSNDTGGATHDEAGWYDITLDTTDTNTLGRLQLQVHESGALPVFHEFMIVPSNVWDSFFGADNLEVDVTLVEGSDATDQIRDAVVDDATRIDASALNTLSSHDPGSQIAAQSDVTGLNDPTAAAIADAVWDELQSAHTTVGSFGEVATEVASILVDTAEIGAAGAGLTGIPWNASWDAEVQSECTDALNAYDPPTKAELDSGLAALNDLSAAEVNAEVDTAIETYHLDHLLAATYDPASKPGAADALLNELVENDGGVSRFTANALEEAPTDGTPPTAAAIADAVWDEAQSAHTSAGSFGEVATEVASILVDTAEIGSGGAGLNAIPWNASWDAEVQSECTDALNAYDPPTKAELDTAQSAIQTDIGNLENLSAAQVNAEVDTAIETYHLDHLLAATYDPTSKPGAADALLNELVENDGGVSRFTANALEEAPNNSFPTAAAIADAVWDEAQADHTSAGSFGEVATEVASILVDTAEIGAAGAGLTGIPWNASWDAEVQSECADALTAYDPPTKAELDSGLAALNDPTAAAIADAVWDELQSAHVTVGSFGEVATEIASILVDTAEIGAAGAGLTGIPWNASWDAEVQSECTDAINAYDPPTKAELDSGLAALNDLSASEVNAEVVDVLRTDTVSELGSIPAASPTLHEMVQFLYMIFRNARTQTSSQATVANDAGTSIGSASTSDNGTTFTKGKYS